MAHTFLALDMNLIPQWTKDNVPTFWQGRFSNDNSRMLIDGYKENGELVHPQFVLDAWLGGVPNKKEVQAQLIGEAIEYTVQEIKQESTNPESIWYVDPERDL